MFGELVEGEDILKILEANGSRSGKPGAKFTIKKSGEVTDPKFIEYARKNRGRHGYGGSGGGGTNDDFGAGFGGGGCDSGGCDGGGGD